MRRKNSTNQKQADEQRTDEVMKMISDKMDNFVHSIDSNVLAEGERKFNDNDYLTYIVGTVLYLSTLYLSTTNSDNRLLKLFDDEREMVYRKATITAFLLKELGEKVFDQEL